MGWDKSQIADLPLSKKDLINLIAAKLANPEISTQNFVMLTNQYLRLTDPKSVLRIPNNKRVGRPFGSKNKPKPVTKQSIHDIVKELEAQNEPRHTIRQDEV